MIGKIFALAVVSLASFVGSVGTARLVAHEARQEVREEMMHETTSHHENLSRVNLEPSWFEFDADETDHPIWAEEVVISATRPVPPKPKVVELGELDIKEEPAGEWKCGEWRALQQGTGLVQKCRVVAGTGK